MALFDKIPQSDIKLSVVVPCYNEQACLRESVERLHNTLMTEAKLEIIIVDDYSRDNSRSVAEQLMRDFPAIKLIKHSYNQGKGAALNTGFKAATGDVITIHDADLEYNPVDLKRMFNYMQEVKADVVFGTRFQPREARRIAYFWHTLANHVITFACNMFTNLNLTDIECCYKMFTRDVLSRIDIEETRFGVEPELVSKCANMRIGGHKLRIYEMGTDYNARTYEEGKKIGIKDGFRAFWCIVKYNTWKRN